MAPLDARSHSVLFRVEVLGFMSCHLANPKYICIYRDRYKSTEKGTFIINMPRTEEKPEEDSIVKVGCQGRPRPIIIQNIKSICELLACWHRLHKPK